MQTLNFARLAQASSLILISSKNTIYMKQTTILSGYLRDTQGLGISRSITIQLSVDGGLSWGDKATVITGANGYFSYEYSPLNKGIKNFRAVFLGDGTYDPTTSTIVLVTVNGLPTTLAISVSPTSGTIPFVVTISGFLKEKFSGQPLAITETVRLRVTKPDGVTDVVTDAYPDATGHFSINYNITLAGTYKFWTSFAGDFMYDASVSNAVSVPPPFPRWILALVGVSSVVVLFVVVLSRHPK